MKKVLFLVIALLFLSLGQAYADYVTPLVIPYVDVYPQSLRAEAGSAWLGGKIHAWGALVLPCSTARCPLK